MKYGRIILLGAFLTIAASWAGLVLLPQFQYGSLEAITSEETGRLYPEVRFGQAEAGRAIYCANGCIYCHSQQVRAVDFGADLARGWGNRRSVSRDYLRDQPVLLGTMRTGPDLTNIGLRQASVDWHMTHLYNPQTTSKGSVMPPFPFLFTQQKMAAKPSPNAVKLNAPFAPKPGYEVVPKPEATALVAYLLSLKAGVALPEAPLGK